MHPCIKDLPKATECLETTADGGILLQHRHVQALLSQDRSRKEPSQTSSYDDHILLHNHISHLLPLTSYLLYLTTHLFINGP